MALLTKYVDKDTGSTGGNGDIGDKWKYMWEATAAMLADATGGAGTVTDNQWKLYVKASQTYGTDGTSPNPAESDDAGHDGAGGDAGVVFYLNVLGQATLPNVIEGYHTTPGDGGVVSIDCAYDGVNKLTNGIWHYINMNFFTVFKNFDIQNAGGAGIEGGINADNLTFKNVRVRLSGGNGLSADNNISMENCVFDNNGADGINVDTSLFGASCIFRNNTLNGLQVISTTLYNSLVYDNGNVEQILVNGRSFILSCTIDGNDGAASRGIRQDAAGASLDVVNCIIVDNAIGILGDGDAGDRVISRNNLLNGNTDDASAYQTEYDGGDGAPATGNGVGNLGHVTGVPGFTGTYLPGSNAQSVGLSHQYTNNFWTSFDAADNPPEPENE